MNQESEADEDSGGQTSDREEGKLSNGHCSLNGHCRNNGQAEESKELSFAMIPGEKYQFTDKITDGFLALTNYRLIIGHSTTNGTISTNGAFTNGTMIANGFLASPSNSSNGNGTIMNESRMVSGDKISVPLGTIDLVEPKSGNEVKTLYILTKHVRSFKCTFESVEKCQKWYKLLNDALLSKSGEKNLFCFKFYEAGCKLLENSSVYYTLIQALKKSQQQKRDTLSNCLDSTMSYRDQIVTNCPNGIPPNGTLADVSSGTVIDVSSEIATNVSSVTDTNVSNGTDTNVSNGTDTNVSSEIASNVSSGPLSEGSGVAISTKEGSVSFNANAAMMSLSSCSVTSLSSSRVSGSGCNHNESISSNCPTSVIVSNGSTIHSNGSIMNGSNGHCTSVMSMNGLSMSASNLSLYQLPFTNEPDEEITSHSYQPILMTTSMTTSTNSLTTSRDHPLHHSNEPSFNQYLSSEHPLTPNQSSDHPLTDFNSRDHPLSGSNSRINPSNEDKISENALTDSNSTDESPNQIQTSPSEIQISPNDSQISPIDSQVSPSEIQVCSAALCKVSANSVGRNESVIRVASQIQLLLSCDDYSRERIESEYERMDFGSIPGSWKISPINMKYKLCSTYPEYLIVPGKVKDEEVIQVSTFRSFNRIPTVVWRYKKNGCTISRSSQPEVGWLGWRSSYDENLIASIVSSSYYPLSFSSKKLLILDARSYAAAVANRAKGGGCECPEYYPCAEVSFMGLANIHSIRKSFQSIRYLCQYPVDPNTWHLQLDNSRWLHHIAGLIKTALIVVNAIDVEERPVLVHCSDGWDRTPQIVSLAEILLDPFYRTIIGFELLIQREWIDFGHKFADRCNNGSGLDDPNERCPVFLQWLDCVHQLVKQFPNCFEFNLYFLEKLILHVHSCLFGTFTCNNQAERMKNQINKSTFSLWLYLNNSKQQYLNKFYVATDKPLRPSIAIKDMIFWSEIYGPSMRHASNDTRSINGSEVSKTNGQTNGQVPNGSVPTAANETMYGHVNGISSSGTSSTDLDSVASPFSYIFKFLRMDRTIVSSVTDTSSTSVPVETSTTMEMSLPVSASTEETVSADDQPIGDVTAEDKTDESEPLAEYSPPTDELKVDGKERKEITDQEYNETNSIV